MIAQPSVSLFEYGKTELATITSSPNQQRMRVLELTLQLLIARTRGGEYWTAGLGDVGRLLASLPSRTPEFVSATRHLKNAASYCQENEFGAATFELRALRGYLQRIL